MRPKKDRQPEYMRDARLEGLYKFDRRGERSALAYVTLYREELVAAYLTWREIHRSGGDASAIVQWEAERFGAPLYASAHGVVAIAIGKALKAAGDRG